MPLTLHTPSSTSPAPHVAGVFDRLEGHEQVVFCSDPATGLRAIVAIHSTVLGPSLGGTRFYPYADEATALEDVLHLSRGMTFKAAVAGLPLGGGKAVIIGDPATAKTPELLRAYGRFVEGLAGRYYTACDVGTFSADMDVVAQTCRFVTGRSEDQGGAGDSSVLTAYGVLQGMRASAQVAWGSPALAGRRVGVAGVGKVGRHLVGHLVDEGADVVVTDVSRAALDAVVASYPGVRVVGDTAALLASELDVYAPCALGGAIDADVAASLTARIVCGAANNQLVSEDLAEVLAERGVLYAPDYVVNSGGLVQVADELEGFSFERARKRVDGVFDTTLEVLERAGRDGVTPETAAEAIAQARIDRARADRELIAQGARRAGVDQSRDERSA
jgi:valine dehydrogenase (NAD+)